MPLVLRARDHLVMDLGDLALDVFEFLLLGLELVDMELAFHFADKVLHPRIGHHRFNGRIIALMLLEQANRAIGGVFEVLREIAVGDALVFCNHVGVKELAVIGQIGDRIVEAGQLGRAFGQLARHHADAAEALLELGIDGLEGFERLQGVGLGRIELGELAAEPFILDSC